jgi:hypothetical protein
VIREMSEPWAAAEGHERDVDLVFEGSIDVQMIHEYLTSVTRGRSGLSTGVREARALVH